MFFLICAVVKSNVQQAPSLFFTCTVTDGSASKYSVALSVGGSVKFVVPYFTPILEFPASVLALALSCGERQYKRERPIFRGTVNSQPRKGTLCRPAPCEKAGSDGYQPQQAGVTG